MELEWKKIEVQDRALFLPYLYSLASRSAETTFANLYLWSRQYPTGYAVVGDFLVMKSLEEEVFAFPAGTGDLRKIVEALDAYQRERGQALAFQCVTREQFAQLEALFPGRFQIEYDRDYADYVYDAENLANLSGKKYHGKKNHVNKFQKQYPDWSYEPMTADNLEDCFQMALIWRRENGCEEDVEKNAEMCVALNALRLFTELSMEGGVLRVGGEVVAFTLGERACEDTFVVHIEKARADIEGAYTMINQQFVQHALLGKYKYVNREDDVGAEGLRKAKLSYHPAFMVDKGYVTEK